MPTRDELFSAAERLHAHLVRRHYSAGLLRGPDAGVRFNLRLWRFVKSALDFIPWQDNHVFMQTQGYWILATWMLHEMTGEPRYRGVARESTEAVLRLQQPEGYWIYPLPERKHLIATVEGDWGAIALLATYARESLEDFRACAVCWYDFLVAKIGFQAHTQGEAVNYFQRPRGKVPNNSVEVLWLCLRLWKATGAKRFLEHVGPLLDFLQAVRLPSGELPYIVESPYEVRREHYLCYQYNAFQFLKLAWSQKLNPDVRIAALMLGLARFLEKGVSANGASAADCFHTLPEVDYYTAVLAAALYEAEQLGLIGTPGLSEKCFGRVLERQRPDGSFGYSTGDYGFLRDGRSYPRPQAMTLFHLLYPMCGDGFEKKVES
ncbi:MAG: hypothetical protein LAP13_26870 [Acidobacteriia bacterium]|nr:hypothetical protein [Terriglobia bacterium]